MTHLTFMSTQRHRGLELEKTQESKLLRFVHTSLIIVMTVTLKIQIHDPECMAHTSITVYFTGIMCNHADIV